MDTLYWFWDEHAPPCRSMDALIQGFFTDIEDHVRVRRLDAREYPHIANNLGVQAVPSFVLLRQGQVISSLAGYQSNDSLRSWIARHVPALASRLSVSWWESASNMVRSGSAGLG